jgi:hypothetical protein
MVMVKVDVKIKRQTFRDDREYSTTQIEFCSVNKNKKGKRKHNEATNLS